MTVVRTSRLVLEPCRPADRADFVELERDPEVMRYLNGGEPVDRQRVDPDATFLMPDGTESYVWTARQVADAAFVGWFCLWPESDAVSELGYRLRRAAWGRGLATEGARALVDWGFRNSACDQIVARTMVLNQGSRRVLEKVGLTHTKTVPFKGKPYSGTEQGEVWYALSRERWRSRS
ncbi:MAG: GNAT family N-acetyltransferase [Alphaproteobacteria bacterium]|nr:GNAT family N-acetyltransferase [Alphaproteobacteria bacterium]